MYSRLLGALVLSFAYLPIIASCTNENSLSPCRPSRSSSSIRVSTRPIHSASCLSLCCRAQSSRSSALISAISSVSVAGGRVLDAVPFPAQLVLAWGREAGARSRGVILTRSVGFLGWCPSRMLSRRGYRHEIVSVWRSGTGRGSKQQYAQGLLPWVFCARRPGILTCSCFGGGIGVACGCLLGKGNRVVCTEKAERLRPDSGGRRPRQPRGKQLPAGRHNFGPTTNRPSHPQWRWLGLDRVAGSDRCWNDKRQRHRPESKCFLASGEPSPPPSSPNSYPSAHT